MLTNFVCRMFWTISISPRRKALWRFSDDFGCPVHSIRPYIMHVCVCMCVVYFNIDLNLRIAKLNIHTHLLLLQ